MSVDRTPQILIHPDPRLKRVAEPVVAFDDELAELVATLERAMGAGPGAVGIAAPQLGINLRLCIVDVSGRKRTPNHGRLVLVNPEITGWEGMAVGREGCLSVPDYTGNVIRAERVGLRAQGARGEVYENDLEGFEARAVQHEVDHLDGLLFWDRLVSRSGGLFRRKVYQR